MMRQSSWLLVLALLPPGCGRGSVNPALDKPAAIQPLAVDDQSVKDLARNNAAFAVSLYQTLRTEPGNMIFSPYSVSAVLAMTYDGARGQTADEMAKVLRFPIDRKQLPPAFAKLDRQLRQKSEGFELTLANNLWGQSGFPFEPDFRETLRDFYDADIKLVDFESEAGRKEATDAINQWVRQQTRNKITDLIGESDLNKSTRLVLVNAVYSNGRWAAEFKPDRTEPGKFFVAPNKPVMVPMMHGSDMPIRYAYFDDVEIAEFPYRGDQASFVVVLPSTKVPLIEFEKTLTVERLEKLLSKLRTDRIDVSLPRLKLKQRSNLKEALIALGMPQAFDDRAMFLGTTKREPFWIDQVIQEATLDVDEKGVVAAAATLATQINLSDGEHFDVNRPFLFLIRDRATGSILFLGRVVDPSQS